MYAVYTPMLRPTLIYDDTRQFKLNENNQALKTIHAPVFDNELNG